MTPMMEQYLEVKRKYEGYFLFYRIGDFYEMFFDDAKRASALLDLTLTGRDCGEAERAPMCGVPYHAAEAYIGKLVSMGYKIAICEQTEDPAKAVGLVRREVIRVVTPGTVVENTLLSEGKNNYLASVASVDDVVGVAFCDISTGEFSATMFMGPSRFDRLVSEVATYQPSEIIAGPLLSELGALEGYVKRVGIMTTSGETKRFSKKECEQLVRARFGDYTPDDSNIAATTAAGALLSYIAETQKLELSYISKLDFYAESQYLVMDAATRRNLELCETMRAKEKRGSLLGVLDHTKTPMGARFMRRSVELPLVNSFALNRRLDAVGELKDDMMLREECFVRLSNVRDIERLLTKLVYGNANARDLLAIGNSIAVIPELLTLLSDVKSDELREIRSDLDPLDDLRTLIESAIEPECPLLVREGGMIRAEYNDEVKRLRHIVNDSNDILDSILEREKAETGIKTMKRGYNRVFGYYLEVTRSQSSLVPDRYIRKQTLTGAERYITEELKNTEAEILGASEKLNNLEYDIFKSICTTLTDNSARIQKSASGIARLDFLLSLAETAAKQNYVRPEVDYGDETSIHGGRHPVVEQFVEGGTFVPNDTLLDTGHNRLMLITGPNMAGKSTYMRQVALITVMAQTGSFVPADEARVSICDKVFTRVGASDDLASGQSTFMLEMMECANILKSATERSLIIYDEIGRGTSTYDGMAIAKAIAEYTAKSIRAKTLFATHYHELCGLEGELEGAVNYNITAKKVGDGVIFLRKIVRGGADDSYGIEVAGLAGVPSEVVKRAKAILRELVKGGKRFAKTAPEPVQPSLDEVLNAAVADELRRLDPNSLTPIEALNKLCELKKILAPLS